jgi:hypothetical protein
MRQPLRFLEVKRSSPFAWAGGKFGMRCATGTVDPKNFRPPPFSPIKLKGLRRPAPTQKRKIKTRKTGFIWWSLACPHYI